MFTEAEIESFACSSGSRTSRRINPDSVRIRRAASSAEMQRIAAFALEMSSLTGTGILLPSGNVRQLAVVLQPPNESGAQLRQTALTASAGAEALASRMVP